MVKRGLWALVGAGVIHVLEEFLLDWRSWATHLSGVSLSWTRFWLLNACFLVFAVAAAAVGRRSPRFSLALPSLVLINAVGFHIGPTVVMGGISPGVFSAAGLYVPLGAWVFWHAAKDGLLTWSVAVGAAGLGAALMSLPFVLLAIG